MIIQKDGSHKIFVKFLRSRSLDFCTDCQCLGVSNFCKVVSDYRSRSHILKGKKVLGSKRKVSLLPFATPLFRMKQRKHNMSIEDFFRVYFASSKYEGGYNYANPRKCLKVMQTLGCISGLHNALEFSHPPECLDEAI